MNGWLGALEKEQDRSPGKLGWEAVAGHSGGQNGPHIMVGKAESGRTKA